MKDSFYIYTNPLFWLTILILGIPALFIQLWNLSNIKGWWFYFFVINEKADKEKFKILIEKNEVIQKSNMNRYTKWMWRLATSKMKRILKLL